MNRTLFKLLNKENIQLQHQKLEKSLLGCYYSKNNKHLIIINSLILHDKKLYNTILLEELGHYFTSIGDSILQTHNSYRDNLKHLKSENTALKWAVNFFIPTSELLAYFDSNYNNISIQELSNYFEVTEDFINAKFYYMSLEKNTYCIKDSIYLALCNLPNVYIYEDYEGRNTYGYNSKTW